MLTMEYTITYYNETVKADIEALPLALRVRYTALTQRMAEVGANLGVPHTEGFGNGLFELRLKGPEGIARVFYCTLQLRSNVCRRCRQIHGSKSDGVSLDHRRINGRPTTLVMQLPAHHNSGDLTS